MSKLGYTFYPKDWQTDDSVFCLTLEERAVYREFIDLAFLHDNKIEFDLSVWSRKLNTSIENLSIIVDSLLKKGLILDTKNTFKVPSCEKRLNLIRGGKKGGQKSRKNKPSSKPNVKGIVKPISKPSSNQREIEIEKETYKRLLIEDLGWQETLKMQLKLRDNVIQDLYEKYNNHIKLQGTQHDTYQEWKKHFYYYLTSENSKGRLSEYQRGKKVGQP